MLFLRRLGDLCDNLKESYVGHLELDFTGYECLASFKIKLKKNNKNSAKSLRATFSFRTLFW